MSKIPSFMPNYYPFGLQHKGYNTFINGTEHPYKYNGKELNQELNLSWYDYGARNYDPALGRWMNMDPLAEEFQSWTPYHYVHNAPINLIDPDGRAAAAPIYGTDGEFLGTDDQGLQGKAIVLDETDFKQGMSHEEALANNQGAEGLENAQAGSKLLSHYEGLKDRPDYDGELTLAEANDWYRNGNGDPLFVDLSKVDLDFISTNDFENGNTRSIQTLFSSDDGLIYGNITLTHHGENKVTSAPDVYNFERHNKRSTASSPLTRAKQNALRGVRNAATVVGRMVADRFPFNLHNQEFKINFYGQGNISN